MTSGNTMKINPEATPWIGRSFQAVRSNWPPSCLQFKLWPRNAPLSPVVANRGRRVLVLLGGIVALSLADLVLTITYLQTIGLWEANPVARLVIEKTGSPWALAALKLVTTIACVGILYAVRAHRPAEMASWCGLIILSVLSVQWHCYSHCLSEPDVIRALSSDKELIALGLTPSARLRKW